MSYSAPERLLRSLGIEKPEEIDLDAIAWSLGAKVKYRPLKSCEARICGCGDRAIISVDCNKMPQRQRFSVGHEIGHWTYHRGQLLVCRSSDIGSFGGFRKGAFSPGLWRINLPRNCFSQRIFSRRYYPNSRRSI